MSITSPPQALLRLTRKAVSLLGNGNNRFIIWRLPQCNISSNTYGGQTGVFGLLNCIAIQNGAVSAVVWFYLPSNGRGVVLSFQNNEYPTVLGTIGSYTPWIYIGLDGNLYVGDWTGTFLQVTTQIKPGWHMIAVSEWASSSTGPYYISVYLDGVLVGQVSTSSLPLLFGANNNCPYNYIGGGFASGWPSAPSGWFYFNGVIAYIALYNRVLGHSDVASIYQGNRVANGLVAEYSGDTYDPSTQVWLDDVSNYVTIKETPDTVEVIDFVTTEYTGGINYDLLAQKIAEKVSAKSINISNISYIYTKNVINVFSNASITSNGSTGNYYAGPYKDFLVFIYVGSVGGTSPSLTVYFNVFDTYSNQSIPIASVTLTSAGATYMLVQGFPGQQFNISWTVGVTSPSFGSVYISVYESW